MEEEEELTGVLTEEHGGRPWRRHDGTSTVVAARPPSRSCTVQKLHRRGGGIDTQRANDGIMISPHLFEANGKLLMVKRDQYQYVTSRGYNRKVEIFEADIGASMWTLVLEVCRGLGALFCE
jgi:hypothetical protein